ncbi:unnamed protein product [Prorocentrum cordatum]|uniref:Uncharacterized protein n=1 Tax=Prorocentrum cordatum TaxID=2364126 RepID=A0ABN9S2N3_9DINO|nr:unnamed protein product [Polarella glacialis]
MATRSWFRRSSNMWLQMAGLVPVSLYFLMNVCVAFVPSEWCWGWTTFMIRSPGSVNRVEVQGVRSGVKVDDIRRFVCSYLQAHQSYIVYSDNCQAYAQALEGYVRNGGQPQLLKQTFVNTIVSPYLTRLFAYVNIVTTLSSVVLMVLIMVVDKPGGGENANNLALAARLKKGWHGSQSERHWQPCCIFFQLCFNVVSGVMIIAMGDVNLLPVCVALFMFGLWFACSDFFFGVTPRVKQGDGTFPEPLVPPMAAHPEEENLKCVVMSKAMFWMVNFYVIAYPIVAVLYCRLPDVSADMHRRNHKIKIMEFLLSLFWSVAFSHLLYKCIVERMKDAQGSRMHSAPSYGTHSVQRQMHVGEEYDRRQHPEHDGYDRNQRHHYVQLVGEQYDREQHHEYDEYEYDEDDEHERTA